MDFVEFAMAIEKEGMEYYERLSAATTDKEAAGIFGYLAKEERRHYEIFDAWRVGAAALPLEETGIFGGNARTVFKRLTNHFEMDGIAATHYYNAYEKAFQFEQKSITVYEEALPKLTDEARKNILIKIIAQEKTHADFIANMLEFLRHPGEWLENAEWVHHEEF